MDPRARAKLSTFVLTYIPASQGCSGRWEDRDREALGLWTALHRGVSALEDVPWPLHVLPEL